MKITQFGAGGTIGQRIAREALARGHELTAVVRAASGYQKPDSSVSVIEGDVTDAQSIESVVDGADAVISSVGPRAQEDPGVLVDAATALVEGLARAGSSSAHRGRRRITGSCTGAAARRHTRIPRRLETGGLGGSGGARPISTSGSRLDVLQSSGCHRAWHSDRALPCGYGPAHNRRPRPQSHLRGRLRGGHDRRARTGEASQASHHRGVLGANRHRTDQQRRCYAR